MRAVDVEKISLTSKINTSLVNSLSEKRGEPGWVLRKRLASAEIFNKLSYEMPVDSPTEKSYTKLDDLLASKFELSGDFSNIRVSYATPPRGLEEKGLLLLRMRDAVQKYPELVRDYFSTVVKPEENKFLALHYAFWGNSFFIYVPEGVQVREPIEITRSDSEPNTLDFTHTLVVAERGSSINLIARYFSPPEDGASFHGEVTEVIAHEGARVRFDSLHNWCGESFDYVMKRARVEKNARMKWVVGSFGSRLTIAQVDSVLAGEGSRADTYSLFIEKEKQHIDLSTNAFHLAPRTGGEMFARGVADDEASAVYRGRIKIEKNAPKTVSHLAGNVLLLSDKAKANALPTLEIDNNDVQSKHAASVGQLDENQLFYLMTRGIERADAERMVVRGFYEPLMKNVDIQPVKEEFGSLIEQRLEE